MGHTAVVKGFPDLSAEEISTWKTLQATNPAIFSPYFTHGYVDAVDSVRPGVKVLCVQSDAGEPLAFLPFRKSLTGVARPIDGLLSDLHGMIVGPSTRIDLLPLLREANLYGYSFTSLPYQQASSGEIGTQGLGNHIIDLSDGYDAYVADRQANSKHFRQHYKKSQALFKDYDIEIVHDDFNKKVFERLVELKRERLNASNFYDIFQDSWVRNLLEKLVKEPKEDVRGTMSYVRVDGELAAMAYSMMSASTLHFWFPAFEQAFSHLAVGHLMTFAVMEWGASQGATESHFGTGRDNRKSMMASYYAPVRKGYLVSEGFHKLAGRVSIWSEENEDDGLRRIPAKLVRKYERVALTGSLKA